MHRNYQTKNVDLAATIKAVSGTDPAISFDSSGICTFAFPESTAVTSVVMRYESGLLTDARVLLTTRNQLYKRIRCAGGGA